MNSASYEKLEIKAPKDVSRSTQLFASFFSDFHKLAGSTLDPLCAVTFEVQLHEHFFAYSIVASAPLLDLLSSLIKTKFPAIELVRYDFNADAPYPNMMVMEYGLARSYYFPFRTSFSSEEDPYKVMAAILSNFSGTSDGIILQLQLLPTGETWFRQFFRERFFGVFALVNNIKVFFKKPFLERESIDYYHEVTSKFSEKLFLAHLRLLSYAASPEKAQHHISLLSKALGKLDNGDINALIPQKSDRHDDPVQRFLSRAWTRPTMLINAKEAASIYHFPDTELHIENVERISSKKIEPPQLLPQAQFLANPEISVFGNTSFGNTPVTFGIKRADRNRHVYIIGKTGMGKSKLIELLASADIHDGKGVCIIDPHGDLATDILTLIPKDRVADVVYLNPADQEFPVGFNPLSTTTPEGKHQVVTGFIAIFKKLFAHNWTSRLEHMLRFILLALTEVGDVTVVDIVKLLTNVEFRHEVIAKLHDPVVKNFWTHEFAAWNEKFDNEAIIPIINHVGQFITNDYIRYTVGQKHSAFDFYRAMQEGKILIINIAKGKLGEENTALLGSMIITKLQEATMARVNIPERDRREFYLYVDEFQHFATEAFNQLLSEARKFNVSITIAHQYLGQLTDSIRKTVFGNVGSFISFRVGPEDGQFLATEFTPAVSAEDLINLDVRSVYAKIAIDGKTSEPFSAATLTVPTSTANFAQEVITASRTTYGALKNRVQHELEEDTETIRLISTITESSDNRPTVTGSLSPQFEEPIV